MKYDLQQLSREAGAELENILAYWIKYAVDEQYGGFAGKITHDNKVHPGAPKGSVMHSRVLYAFSAAYNLTGKKEYLDMAHRAFEYISGHFIDRAMGGVYWTVTFDGKPLDNKKQVYALSFAVYALSEYYLTEKKSAVLDAAVCIYEDIIKYSYDNINGGYIEALTHDWQPINDLRLSNKDANEKKSMNTHLHVLEAFAGLYRIWPDRGLKERIVELSRNFLEHIIHPSHHHLILFFDDAWNRRSDIISYGHDIEAAWLLQESVEIAGGEAVMKEIKTASVKLAEAAVKAMDFDGGLWYEYEPSKKRLIKEKHSWPQAEAIVGFFNAWQLTKDEKFLGYCFRTWNFIKQHMVDRQGGEWYWGLYEDYSVMDKEDKAGIWKCPYHNSRACIEIIKRIKTV